MTSNAWMARKEAEKEMANETEQVFKNAEINIFVKTPQGFKAHIKIVEMDWRKVATVLENVGAALENHNFSPDSGPSGNGSARQEAAHQNPACETCGQPTEHKTGKGQKGPWAGYFCISGNKDHKVHWV